MKRYRERLVGYHIKIYTDLSATWSNDDQRDDDGTEASAHIVKEVVHTEDASSHSRRVHIQQDASAVDAAKTDTEAAAEGEQKVLPEGGRVHMHAGVSFSLSAVGVHISVIAKRWGVIRCVDE